MSDLSSEAAANLFGFSRADAAIFPQGWELRPCSAITERIMVGIVIRPAQYYVRHGVPALRSANIREAGITASDLVFISERSNELLCKSTVKVGDVLTVRTGYPGTSAVVTPSFAGANCIDILISRPSATTSPEYLAAWINSPFGKNQVLQKQGGLAQQHFNVGDMRNLIVALPPLQEQRRIAAVLNDLDALIRVLDRLIVKKRHLKQAAMQQLLTGQTRLPGFRGDWAPKRLGDCLIARPDYGINAAAVPFSDRLPAYIRITDISEDGRFSPQPRVSVDASRSTDYFLNAGDLVFARTGASVGKSYLYDSNDGDLVFAGFLIRVRPNAELLLPRFLSAYARTRSFWSWVQQTSTRSGQPGINGKEYARMPLTLPPLVEQNAIAAALADMDAQIAAIEQRREKLRQLKQGMTQELLTGRVRLV